MIDQQQEQMSALQDGELGRDAVSRLSAAAGQDPATRALWERYHLIGNAMRGERIDPRLRVVADAVRDSLAAEPIAITRPGRRPRLGPRYASFAGAALAAGAAFIAVFAVPGLFHNEATESSNGSPPQLAMSAPAPDSEAARWHLAQPALASKLDLYLVNHQERAPATGMKGMLPYAALVSYEGGR